MAINTIFQANADKLAQITSAGSPAGAISPIYAAAVNLASVMQYASYIRILGVNATSAACAVTTTYLPTQGNGNMQISCEAVGGVVTYTFGAGFKVSATAAPTAGTAITIEFNWNGANWIEAGRSTAITI